MKEFIVTYWLDISVVIFVVVGLLLLYRRGNREMVKKVILGFVVQAEKTLGSKTGELKYSLVINAVYTYLPTILRCLYTKEDINKFVEEGVETLKKQLESGVTLSSYEEELKEGK